MDIADRCIKWMEEVIRVHKALYDPEDLMEDTDIKAIEDARYVIECIKRSSNIDE